MIKKTSLLIKNGAVENKTHGKLNQIKVANTKTECSLPSGSCEEVSAQ